MKCPLKQQIIYNTYTDWYREYKLDPKQLAKLKTIMDHGKIENFEVEEIVFDGNLGKFQSKVSFTDIEDKNAISVVREVEVEEGEEVEEAVKEIYPNAEDIVVWGKKYNNYNDKNSYLVSFFIVTPTDSNQVDCPTNCPTKITNFFSRTVEELENSMWAKYKLDPVEIAKILTLNDFGKVENLKIENYMIGNQLLFRVEFIDIPDKDLMIVKEIKVRKGETIEQVVKELHPNAKDIIVWAHTKNCNQNYYIVSFSNAT
jgi:uncharacterized protein YdhG (YjbR/CyaY superfamily)